MSFWTENTTEPKRNFRWRVTLGGAFAQSSSGGIVWWAKTVGTPSYTVTETPHQFFDNEYYFPGRVKWEPVSMTLVDPISPNAVQMTNQIVLDAGYSIKGSQDFGNKPTSITKVGMNNAVGSVLIEVLKGDGTPVETWTLNNPFLTSVKFSTLDYSNDDMRTIDLTWRYDWANCLNPDGSFGDQIQFPKPGEQ